MRFSRKKSYGNYQIIKCPFCERRATQKNEQGLNVCHLHTKNTLEEIKCTCGSWLEAKSGKYGPYFNCLNCGNLSYQKGMEIKTVTKVNEGVIDNVDTSNVDSKVNNNINDNVDNSNVYHSEDKSNYDKNKTKKETTTNKRKEITITTDDLEYFS